MANYLDNLSGSGSIYGHTADSGQGYLQNSDPPSGAFTLTGSNTAYSTYPSLTWAAPNYTLGNDQRFRFVFRIVGSPAVDNEVGCFLRLTGETGAKIDAGGYYVGFVYRYLTGLLDCHIDARIPTVGWANGTEAGISGATTGLSIADGNLIDVTVSGGSTPALAVSIQGTQVMTYTDGANYADSGKVSILQFSGAATNYPQFGRCQACTLGYALNYAIGYGGGVEVGQPVTITVTPETFHSSVQKINGTVTLTPSGCGLSTPQAVTFSDTATPQVAYFTPTAPGTLTIAATNDQYMIDPGSPLSIPVSSGPFPHFTRRARGFVGGMISME